jgi:hypothetical protein
VSNYRLTMYDPFGANPVDLGRFEQLEWARVVNGVGAATITVPYTLPWSIFRRDNRILIERQAGAAWETAGETIYFLRRWGLELEGGLYKYSLLAFDANDLLRRRIVAYAAGSAQAKKAAAPATNLMKAVVRENLGALSTGTGRDLSDYLTIPPNDGAGASIAKAFSRRQVLTVLQEVALSSALAGTYVAFDIVASTVAALTFRTYTGQRGADRRYPGGSAVVLSPEQGNLTSLKQVFDATEEATVAYAGGQGEGEERAVATATDSARLAASPFNRIEIFKDARNTDTEAALQDEADATLRAARPKRIFAARVNDTAGTQFGVHYRFGDYVTAQFAGESFDCRIEAVKVTVAGGDETVDVQLRSET